MRYFEEIEKYIPTADFLLKNLLFKLSPLYKEEFGEEQEATVPLFVSLHSTSESILVLLLNQAIFDADILLRSVMEGTIKYCYLMTGTTYERYEKYQEYKVSLTEIDKLSDHFKTLETIEILKKYSGNSLKPFESYILEEEKVRQLQEKYPKNKRSELKRKWGYQSLIRALAEKRPEYQAQIGTLSTYSLESHFGHYDWTGVSTRQEQMGSSAIDDNELYDIVHSLRIISNTLSMALFRTAEYLRCNNHSSSDVSEFSLKILEYLSEIDNIQNKMLNDL